MVPVSAVEAITGGHGEPILQDIFHRTGAKVTILEPSEAGLEAKYTRTGRVYPSAVDERQVHIKGPLVGVQAAHILIIRQLTESAPALETYLEEGDYRS